MIMLRKATAYIIVLAFFGMVFYDIYAYFYGGEGATLSEVYLAWTGNYPYIVFITGYLCGHLTWPQKVVKE